MPGGFHGGDQAPSGDHSGAAGFGTWRVCPRGPRELAPHSLCVMLWSRDRAGADLALNPLEAPAAGVTAARSLVSPHHSPGRASSERPHTHSQSSFRAAVPALRQGCPSGCTVEKPAPSLGSQLTPSSEPHGPCSSTELPSGAGGRGMKCSIVHLHLHKLPREVCCWGEPSSSQPLGVLQRRVVPTWCSSNRLPENKGH